MIKRLLLVITLGLFLSFGLGGAPFGAQAAPSEGGKWGEVATQLNELLDKAEKQYRDGKTEEAVDSVRSALYDVYVGKGLKTAISSEISGGEARVFDVSLSRIARAMRENNTEDVDKYLKAVRKELTKSTTILSGGKLQAETLSPGKWGQVAKTMLGLLDESAQLVKAGKGEAAKDKVNEAYYGHYEITGFEKVVLARVSGARVAKVEMQFGLIKQAMVAGQTDKALELLDELEPWLIEDANTLDGFDGTTGETGSQGATVFFGSFTIILREGLEAMLVVAAVIAYLVKAGHKDKTKVVWGGAGLALALSVVMAVAISSLTGLAGKSQELIEGITALFAVAMLIYVSNWMLGKTDAAAWDRYIKSKTDDSLSRGSLLSLAFVAFLAVLREGAETILFYQPILAIAGDDTHLVWLGLALGIVALAAIYALYRVFSWRIPLRPFFIFTSVLLAIMAVTFTGSGIRELQEADVVSITPINGLPTIDLLGIYPRVENLTAQVVVLAIIVGLFWFAKRKAKAGAQQNKNDETQPTAAAELSEAQ